MTSLNAYMHPRNIYRNPLNFDELCSQYPELLNYTHKKPNGKIIFNFKERDGLRCLATVLLKRDFDLQIIIPENTLVPTLPLRLNYILWIEDLLQSSSKNISEMEIKGIDIGTGASCIYPLLIAKKNCWKMIGTDIEDDTINTARENVQINRLDHLISITKVSSSSLLESILVDQDYDFCMCNPPFFDRNEHELPLPKKRNRAERQREARLQASGTSNEISSPGGEITFIKKIIANSTKLRNRIKIYTTMIGCRSSVHPVLDILKESQIDSYCETQFCQGRTMRWAVAWTFTDVPLKTSTPPLPPKEKALKPLIWTLQSKYNFKECVDKMDLIFKKLQVQFCIIKQNKNAAIWKIQTHRNTWTGLRRLRRKQQREGKSYSCINQTNFDLEQKSSTISLSTDIINCNSSKEEMNFKADSDTDDELYGKKTKLNEPYKVLVLEADIELKKLHKNEEANISIGVTFIKGQKETPQQILQYFKNNLI